MKSHRTALLIFLLTCSNALVAQTKNDSAYESLFFSNIRSGNSFYFAGRQDSARYYFRKAKDIAFRDSLTGHEGLIKLNELGIAYGRMDRLDSAYDFFKRAGEINAILYGDKKNPAFATLCKNVGDYFLLAKNVDSAIARYHYAIIQLVPGFNDPDTRLNPIEFAEHTSDSPLFEALSLKAKALTLGYYEDKNKNHLVSSVNAYDAIFRLIDYVSAKSKDQGDEFINSKNFSPYQPTANCLLLFDITGDEVFLRNAFRFSEKVRTGDNNVIPIRKLQSQIPDNNALLSYQVGDTSIVVFLITNQLFKHALVKIDSNFLKKAHTPSDLRQKLMAPLSPDLANISNIELVDKNDNIATLWNNKRNEAGESENKSLIWVMIAAACVLGLMAGSSFLKVAKRK